MNKFKTFLYWSTMVLPLFKAVKGGLIGLINGVLEAFNTSTTAILMDEKTKATLQKFADFVKAEQEKEAFKEDNE